MKWLKVKWFQYRKGDPIGILYMYYKYRLSDNDDSHEKLGIANIVIMICDSIQQSSWIQRRLLQIPSEQSFTGMQRIFKRISLQNSLIENKKDKDCH